MRALFQSGDPQRSSFARRAACGVLVAGLALALSARASAAVHPQVVGGQETTIEAVPFQVALYDPEVDNDPAASQFCGGVIRDATHVITAAHCVFDDTTDQTSAPQEIEVLAGSENLNDTAGAVADPVRVVSFNPAWEPISGEHDDALLTLEFPLWNTLTPPTIGAPTRIAPIKLATSAPNPPTSATVSGWGFTEELRGEQQPTEKEAEEYFLPTLRSVGVPLVSAKQCAEDYGLEKGETFGPDFLCAGEDGKDSCYGDSGGPLFTGPPGSDTDQLIGTVDLGRGCGQKGFPGLYQSVSESENRAFLDSESPQGPFQTPGSLTTISGTAQPGQTLTCQAGSWAGAPELLYTFFSDESEYTKPFLSAALTVEDTPDPSYLLPPDTPVGTRIFCRVRALNLGGYGQATSSDVSVLANASTAPAPIAPAAAVKISAPTLKLISKSCQRSRCSVNVLASAGTAEAAVVTVQATLTFKQKIACSKRGGCTRTVTRKPLAKSTPGGHFVIAAGRLKPGSYTLVLTAIDKAGIKQTQPTKVTLLLKAPKPKRRS